MSNFTYTINPGLYPGLASSFSTIPSFQSYSFINTVDNKSPTLITVIETVEYTKIVNEKKSLEQKLETLTKELEKLREKMKLIKESIN